ncbi:MAG: hypothetical protein LQ338_005238 [Usnochroma carphineum]|nr:MAG: hypothetical protein LQ338_005238 [Usnochroma carphineum]
MSDPAVHDAANGGNEEEKRLGAQATDAEVPAQSSERSITGIKWFLVVIGILSSAFLFALDNSIVADIQPRIIRTFVGSIDKLPWLSVAFALGGAASTLVWASAYSTFNAKHLYITAVIVFEVGSALCGSANKMDVLIFGRALAGLGGAGLYVGVLTLLSACTSAAERPLYVASTGLVWGFGAVLG